jgi:hypothetical protein
MIFLFTLTENGKWYQLLIVKDFFRINEEIKVSFIAKDLLIFYKRYKLY